MWSPLLRSYEPMRRFYVALLNIRWVMQSQGATCFTARVLQTWKNPKGNPRFPRYQLWKRTLPLSASASIQPFGSRRTERTWDGLLARLRSLCRSILQWRIDDDSVSDTVCRSRYITPVLFHLVPCSKKWQPKVQSKWRHHKNKYYMPTGNWIDKKHGTSVNVTNTNLEQRSQLNKKSLCDITIMLPALQNGASICYNIGKIDILIHSSNSHEINPKILKQIYWKVDFVPHSNIVHQIGRR